MQLTRALIPCTGEKSSKGIVSYPLNPTDAHSVVEGLNALKYNAFLQRIPFIKCLF